VWGPTPGQWGAWRGGLPRCIALVSSLVWKTLGRCFKAMHWDGGTLLTTYYSYSSLCRGTAVLCVCMCTHGHEAMSHPAAGHPAASLLCCALSAPLAAGLGLLQHPLVPADGRGMQSHSVTAQLPFVPLPSASARADSAPRRFRCGSLLLAADSVHKWTTVHFLRQGCRRALVRWAPPLSLARARPPRKANPP
jgi:hypothetical protein